MDSLINIREEKGTLVVGSREVAKNFGKEHYNLVRDIENLVKKNPIVFEGLKFFIQTTFEHKGNEYKEYLLTRDGLALLVMGFTGEKALEWKVKYIEAFNKLERIIFENQPLKLEGLSEEKLLEAESKIQELENMIIVSYEEANEIKKLASERVIKLLENSNITRAKVYGKLWKEYRDKFQVTSYHNTLKKDINLAKEFIDSWSPEVSI